MIIKYNIINISLSDQLRSINFDYGILNMILVVVSLYLYLNELGTCVVLSMGIHTRFRVEKIEHEIMKQVCGVCIRVQGLNQARWDINPR